MYPEDTRGQSENYSCLFSLKHVVSSSDNDLPQATTFERVNLLAYFAIVVVKCHLKFLASVKNNQINETKIVIKLF